MDLSDAVFSAQLLPEFISNCDFYSKHFSVTAHPRISYFDFRIVQLAMWLFRAACWKQERTEGQSSLSSPWKLLQHQQPRRKWRHFRKGFRVALFTSSSPEPAQWAKSSCTTSFLTTGKRKLFLGWFSKCTGRGLAGSSSWRAQARFRPPDDSNLF